MNLECCSCWLNLDAVERQLLRSHLTCIIVHKVPIRDINSILIQKAEGEAAAAEGEAGEGEAAADKGGEGQAEAAADAGADAGGDGGDGGAGE